VSIAEQLFRIEPKIRYIAINQLGLIVEMMQSPSCPSYNSAETDRLEELVVNPIVLEITRRRGEIDIGGTRFVVIRYGVLYQIVIPYAHGHVSISVELDDNPLEIAEKVFEYLERLTAHEKGRPAGGLIRAKA
jgi:hypothetical protein